MFCKYFFLGLKLKLELKIDYFFFRWLFVYFFDFVYEYLGDFIIILEILESGFFKIFLLKFCLDLKKIGFFFC